MQWINQVWMKWIINITEWNNAGIQCAQLIQTGR